MTFYIAQAISILTGLTAILMVQCKSMKGMLLGQIVANLLTASTYFLLGGLSGAAICFTAILQSVVMFLYTMKRVPPHRWVIVAFIALYVACSVLYYTAPVDILSAMAAVCFAISVVQTKPMLSRLWYAFNPLFWLLYDVFTLAYGNLVIHLVVFISTVVAILRRDLRGKEKEPSSR